MKAVVLEILGITVDCDNNPSVFFALNFWHARGITHTNSNHGPLSDISDPHSQFAQQKPAHNHQLSYYNNLNVKIFWMGTQAVVGNNRAPLSLYK